MEYSEPGRVISREQDGADTNANTSIMAQYFIDNFLDIDLNRSYTGLAFATYCNRKSRATCLV